MARQKWLSDDGDHYVSSRLHWSDPIVIGLSWLENINAANGAVVSGIRMAIQQHYNADVDREVFHEDAALEIESLVAGVDIEDDEEE